MMHSTHLIYGYMVSDTQVKNHGYIGQNTAAWQHVVVNLWWKKEGRKEGKGRICFI